MGQNLKIGFDAKRAFLNAAGLGNYSRNTINALSMYFPENEYVLFSPKTNPAQFHIPENASALVPENVWWRFLKSLWRSYRIAGLAKKSGLDIYHGLSHELPFGIEKTGVKSVVTMHDVIFVRFPEWYKPLDRKFYFRKMDHACRVAAKIIAISHQTKDDLVTFFKINPEKVEVIYQSINPLYFEELPKDRLKAVEKKYSLPDEFILTVGTLETRKNLLTLLKAIPLLDRKITLVMVGKKTNYLQTLQPMLEKLKTQLIFLPQADDNDLSCIYRLAKVMVYPSLFEGFGLPVVEAQACGCPVVTSRVSSMPEAGGEGALYADPTNEADIAKQIGCLLIDGKLRNELIGKGKENALRFTPEVYANHLMELYKKL